MTREEYEQIADAYWWMFPMLQAKFVEQIAYCPLDCRETWDQRMGAGD